jgi:hypothetical protein
MARRSTGSVVLDDRRVTEARFLSAEVPGLVDAMASHIDPRVVAARERLVQAKAALDQRIAGGEDEES